MTNQSHQCLVAEVCAIMIHPSPDRCVPCTGCCLHPYISTNQAFLCHLKESFLCALKTPILNIREGSILHHCIIDFRILIPYHSTSKYQKHSFIIIGICSFITHMLLHMLVFPLSSLSSSVSHSINPCSVYLCFGVSGRSYQEAILQYHMLKCYFLLLKKST